MNNEESRVVELLEELVNWTKVTNFPHVKNVLLEVLASPEEKIAYHVSDGEKNSRAVADIAKVAKATITRWWKTWIKLGIAKPVKVRRGDRAQSIFALDEFGIPVPEIKVTNNEANKRV